MGKKIIINGADFSQVAVASNAIAVTGLMIVGGNGTQTDRQIQLSVSYIPANTTQKGVIWSVSGNATISEDGELYYNGSVDGSVVVTATSAKNPNISVSKTIAFAVPQVEAPVFSVQAGTYSADQSVGITGPTGAYIYYTTDGSTPTASNGTLYSSPITISARTTLKAVAVLNGQTSLATSAEYIITGALTVTVVDESDNAVSGATVLFGGTQLTETQTAGEYYALVERGTATLSVSKSGFDTATKSVTVSANSTAESITLTLPLVVDVLESQGVEVRDTITATNLLPSPPTSGPGTLYLMKRYDRSGMLLYNSNGTGFTWVSTASEMSDTKGNYSPVSWPDGYEIIDVAYTGSKQFGFHVFNESQKNVFSTGSNWVTGPFSGRLTRTAVQGQIPSSTADKSVKYLAFAFNGNIGSKTTAQLKEYGLSIMAFKDAAAAAEWYQEQGKTAPNDLITT